MSEPCVTYGEWHRQRALIVVPWTDKHGSRSAVYGVESRAVSIIGSDGVNHLSTQTRHVMPYKETPENMLQRDMVNSVLSAVYPYAAALIPPPSDGE